MTIIPIFGERAHLFNLSDTQQKLLLEAAQNRDFSNPLKVKFERKMVETLQKYFRKGVYDEQGYAIKPLGSFGAQVTNNGLMMFEAGGSGFITPDKTPDFFKTLERHMDSKDYTPDMTYLDFMVSEKMTSDLEKRDTWDAFFEWVKMKEAGQVKYGKLGYSSAQMTSEEYGTGIEFSWKWFEQNKFNINMARLAPKVKFDAFDQQGDNVYGLAIAAWTKTLSTYSLTATNNFIRDYNQAVQALWALPNSFGRKEFAGRAIRIVAPVSMWYIIDIAIRSASQALNVPERFLPQPRVTITTKLNTDGNSPFDCYVVVDKYDQNELGTLIPMEAHGPEDDITTFATKMTWRMDYGAAVNAASAIKLSFDPTADNFSIYGASDVRVTNTVSTDEVT